MLEFLIYYAITRALYFGFLCWECRQGHDPFFACLEFAGVLLPGLGETIAAIRVIAEVFYYFAYRY